MTNHLYLAYKSESPSQLIHDAEYLVRYFCHECGFRPLPWMQRKFTELLNRGYDVPTLKGVIEDTSIAPRPSWAYLAAIIRNSEEQARDYLRRFPPAPPSGSEDHHQEQQ